MAMSTAERARRSTEALRALADARSPLRHIGGGPWTVLAGCPAERHNTVRAARGVADCGNEARIKCVCPRGLELLRQYNENRQVRKRAELARVAALTYLMRPEGADAPDLTGAKCNSALGRDIVDRTLGHRGMAAAEHKAMCARCVVRAKCGEWALKSEPGAGIYGGFDRRDRDKIRAREAKGRVAHG